MRTIEEVKADMEAYTGNKSKKEYRALKSELSSLEALKMDSKGLGDVVKDVIASVGLDKLVEPDCEDCKKRQAKLNDWGAKLSRFFQGAKVKQMTEADYNWVSNYLSNGIPQVITRQDQIKINDIYQRVSGIRKRTSSCAPCVKKVVSALQQYVTEYKLNN